MAYNKWYCYTYEAILTSLRWGGLIEEIPMKVVAIFSWMPQTIMNISHPGKKRKWQVFDAKKVEDELASVSSAFESIKGQKLMDCNLDDLKESLGKVCDVTFKIFGPVAASKYLHFSAPTLIPMWDSGMEGFGRTPEDFFSFMQGFKADLNKKDNLRKASEEYPDNPVRGWDIIGMGKRNQKSRGKLRPVNAS